MVEKLGIEPRTFPMQMERHTTRPHPHMTGLFIHIMTLLLCFCLPFHLSRPHPILHADIHAPHAFFFAYCYQAPCIVAQTLGPIFSLCRSAQPPPEYQSSHRGGVLVTDIRIYIRATLSWTDPSGASSSDTDHAIPAASPSILLRVSPPKTGTLRRTKFPDFSTPTTGPWPREQTAPNARASIRVGEKDDLATP